MKDKLEKTNRKKNWYRFRNMGKACAFAAILAFGSALPIVIVANASTETAAADASTSGNQVDLDVRSMIVETISSYVLA